MRGNKGFAYKVVVDEDKTVTEYTHEGVESLKLVHGVNHGGNFKYNQYRIEAQNQQIIIPYYLKNREVYISLKNFTGVSDFGAKSIEVFRTKAKDDFENKGLCEYGVNFVKSMGITEFYETVFLGQFNPSPAFFKGKHISVYGIKLSEKEQRIKNKDFNFISYSEYKKAIDSKGKSEFYLPDLITMSSVFTLSQFLKNNKNFDVHLIDSKYKPKENFTPVPIDEYYHEIPYKRGAFWSQNNLEVVRTKVKLNITPNPENSMIKADLKVIEFFSARQNTFDGKLEFKEYEGSVVVPFYKDILGDVYLGLQLMDRGTAGLPYCYEVPMGSKDDNETAEECALRELREETGLSVYKNIIPLGSTNNDCLRYNTPNISIFAVEINPEQKQGKRTETAENIGKLNWFDLKKVNELVIKGYIKSLVALGSISATFAMFEREKSRDLPFYK